LKSADGFRPSIRPIFMHQATPLARVRAKAMRRLPTEAERRLWGGLRNRSLAGYKFYRQVPIGPYIVDFLNQEHGVVIEVDGPTHADDAAIARDLSRTCYLESLGLMVYRVSNTEVCRDCWSVLDGTSLVLASRAK
jgi:very-short-patch-repair endonuclease